MISKILNYFNGYVHSQKHKASVFCLPVSQQQQQQRRVD